MKMFLDEFKVLDMSELVAVNGGYGLSSSEYSSSSGSGSNGYNSFSGYTTSSHNTVPEGYSALTGWKPGYGLNEEQIESDMISDEQNDNSQNASTTPGYQIPANPEDYHCDINSYNVAVDQGIQNPGTWDGNASTVDQIYTQNYGNGTELPQAGTQGYGFLDNDGNGTYDHMFYYNYQGGNTYHVWNSPGNTPVTETDWSIHGTAAEQSVFVPLN
ncbi:hypothetical protein [Treponema brennaborense]|uniref:Uncharacterized protein n=1 Tax=Treponema brennaborense (strain DSM 12168 / CIP 105900 / DD5/3) TaxID=906968 RepID=F4LKC9_TREBD|nr:hypothetical protein [Treponema brennaborense]AEE16503.1 hypothetical protein Trebr_1071 [Treponema brennaborense DSM 12168]